MRIKHKTLEHIVLLLFFLFLNSESYSQLILPTSNQDWGGMKRIKYNGNWLMTGTNYVSTPQRDIIMPTEGVDENFGINDYDSINQQPNFNNRPPLPANVSNLPVIRVGKWLSGVNVPRSAQVAEIKFTPTEGNCKVKVHYLGYLQNTPHTQLNIASTNYRSTNSHFCASFGLNNAYKNYPENTVSNTSSKCGRTEFGTIGLNGALPPFVDSQTKVQEYGFNDMMSFVKKGPLVGQFPATNVVGNIYRTPTWDNYIMDFSEFIGGEVTITLFANSSNINGTTQNQAMAFYILEPLNEPKTTIPFSALTITNNNVEHLGCVAELPLTDMINITDVVPTLLGQESNPQTSNNGIPHRWLHLVGTTTEQYASNFASLRLDLVDQNNDVISNYTNFKHANGGNLLDNTFDDVEITLDGPPSYNIAPSATNSNTLVYRFKATYEVKEQPTSQKAYFEYRLTMQEATACEEAFTGNFNIIPENTLEEYSNNGEKEYLICKKIENDGDIPYFEVHLGPKICDNIPNENDPSKFIRYQWQRRSSTGGWVNINGAYSQNLLDAQKSVYHNSCKTDFQRQTITSIPCIDGVDEDGNPIYSESESVFNVKYSPSITIWNEAYIPFDTTSQFNFATWNVVATVPGLDGGYTANNVGLCTPLNVCFGDTVKFEGKLFIGD